jgi:hypothetical protein
MDGCHGQQQAGTNDEKMILLSHNISRNNSHERFSRSAMPFLQVTVLYRYGLAALPKYLQSITEGVSKKVNYS